MLYTNKAIQRRKDTEKKIRSKLTILLYIIIIPIIVYNVTLIFQAVSNPNETPSFFGYKSYVIVSGSMEPSYNIGDVVVVKENSSKTYEVGDAISFRQGQNVVTHRITEVIEEDGQIKYRTKGDNNNADDVDLVNNISVEGEVAFAIPFIGNIVLALQKGVVLTIVLLFAYMYFLYIGGIKKRKHNRMMKRLEYEDDKEKRNN